MKLIKIGSIVFVVPYALYSADNFDGRKPGKKVSFAPCSSPSQSPGGERRARLRVVTPEEIKKVREIVPYIGPITKQKIDAARAAGEKTKASTKTKSNCCYRMGMALGGFMTGVGFGLLWKLSTE